MTPQQLKASLLQEAIQGKLTDQRPEDGSAEELYRAIIAEKKRLIKAGKLKKEKPLSPIEEKDIPFDIPENWKWVRLGEVGELKGGYAFKSSEYKEAGIQVVRIADLDEDTISTRDAVYYQEYSKLIPYLVRKGSFLICMTGSLGKMARVLDDTPRYLNQRVGMFVPLASVNDSFLWYFLHTNHVISKWIGDKTGPNGNIKNESITNLLLPLPPLAEQERIVAKLEELLPLVERYGKAYTQLTALEQRFPASMRKSLLQEAIQGKLTDQRPEDGSAEDLYRAILAEKKRLIKAGKLKKEKPLPPIEEKDIPFDIPENWKWVRLGEITTYAQSKEKIEPSDIAPDTWSLDLEDIEKDSGRVLVRNLARERKITGSKSIFHKGELLYSKLRPYLKKILIAPEDGVCTPELVNFSAYNGISHQYLVQLLRSPYVDNAVNGKTYGVKMPRTNTETMCNLLLPLPPLAEQERIVAKLEELLPLCD